MAPISTHIHKRIAAMSGKTRADQIYRMSLNSPRAGSVMRRMLDEELEGRDPNVRAACRELYGQDYYELVRILGEYHGKWTADAQACSILATLTIGEQLGATSMAGATVEHLDSLRAISRATVLGLGLSLFDHARAFLVDGTTLGILTRPYESEHVRLEAMHLDQEKPLAVWTQASRLCSYYPGRTRSFLILPKRHRGVGLGFERVAQI